uniref:Large ribosomal subunit protein uL6c n=1 Tax=Polysiphonia scopulorum TaxID=257860 RepID=A0A1Z1MIS1_9FLOR|nr:ribosomal protein L6 [Polysiphonia scopulorum]ARW65644.1 ribosomal protein L6 [Polysiphonia scopulorum]
MSRIGKKEIIIPNNTEVILENRNIIVKNQNKEISYTISELVEVEKIKNKLIVKKRHLTQKAQAIHGLSRSIINNMIIGVCEGFEKKLIIEGVGYRAQMEGNNLLLNLGYSHPIRIETPNGLKVKVENNTNISISGISKEQVGQMAAKVRSMRPPEPYKGKGIRYENEIIKRKVGKAGK